MPVTTAVDLEVVKSGHAYVAPADWHLIVVLSVMDPVSTWSVQHLTPCSDPLAQRTVQGRLDRFLPDCSFRAIFSRRLRTPSKS
ncbi:hypothetical protein ACIQUG_32430 [Ensifer sp. NPDC090286]|uniref:hypothetical protein n=1 Tax=Ensifer sp. NPDC090286 TaxID=3363991 RepID=UPI00383A3BF5